MGGEFAEGFFDGSVFAVAEDVEEEEDLPVAAAGGAAFDFGEVQVEVVERGEGLEEGAGFVADTEHDGGAVAAAGWAGAFAEDEEAGRVSGAVLDPVFEDLEPVELSGEGAAEGGGHDLAVDGADAAFGETALHFGVFADEALEDVFFAFRGIDLETGLFFDEADLVDEVSALVEEAEQVAVDGIDFLTEVLERHVVGRGTAGNLERDSAAVERRNCAVVFSA